MSDQLPGGDFNTGGFDNRGPVLDKQGSPRVVFPDTDVKEKAKDAATATDVGANVVLTVAAGATMAAQPEVAGPFAFAGAVFKLISLGFKAVSDDPPRSDFRQDTKVETHSVTVPKVPSYMTGLSELITELLKAAAVVRAELVAMERYSGAMLAGDAGSATKQFSAVVKFHNEAVGAMPKVQRLMRESAGALRSSGRDRVFQRSMLNAGVKDIVFESAEGALQDLGLAAGSIAGLRTSLDGAEANYADGKKLSKLLESTNWGPDVSGSQGRIGKRAT